MTAEIVKELNTKFKNSTPEEVIDWFTKNYAGHIALSSSLGLEDQVLTDMVCKAEEPAPIFTLDTGRLFPETYDLIDQTNKKYGIKIKVMFPQAKAVEEMVNKNGINLFYDSVENRKLCCSVRKLEPLKRAFSGLKVWICGLRQEQSITRYGASLVELDEPNGLIKLNPLVEWNEQQVRNYISLHNVPYNPLHDKNYPSIGCQPCTREVAKGEDLRAGRWWWEQPESKECGLHKR